MYVIRNETSGFVTTGPANLATAVAELDRRRPYPGATYKIYKLVEMEQIVTTTWQEKRD